MLRELLTYVREFLLELETGFAFIGNQVKLTVGDTDYFLDLLFYHVRLRCYVVVELKVGAFKPEHAGKMNFYLSGYPREVFSPRPRRATAPCSAGATTIPVAPWATPR